MMQFVAVLLAFTIHSCSSSELISFLTIGDWGGAALGDQESQNVHDVAKQMDSTAQSLNPKFMINTGDNIYWCGVTDTSDFQWDVDFVEPYSAKSLDLAWYSVLGNHEYGYNVDAQIEYSKLNSKWHLPARYYSERVLLADRTFVSMIFLDTSPCVMDYRNSNEKYWDPCSTEYPTCSISDGDDDFEGPCEFHNHILTQNCTAQFEWFKETLAAVPKDDWLIVAGHHPIDEVDVEDFTTVLQDHGFSLYLNGHAHTLTHYTIDNVGAYVTSGAGALVNTADQSHPVTAAKLKGEHLQRASSLRSATGHSYETVYNNVVAGFTSHTFSSDLTTLTTNFVTYTGEIVHTFTTDKFGVTV